MINQSTTKSTFSIVYTKHPNIALDIAIIPKCKSAVATNFTDRYSEMLAEVRQKSIKANLQYKATGDAFCRHTTFNIGDLVMVRLGRERFPPGAYSKLARCKLGPVPIITKINDNAYTITLPADCNTSPTFNVSDIWAYKPIDDVVVSLSSSESSSYEVGED